MLKIEVFVLFTVNWVASLSIQSVGTFCRFHTVKINVITKYYPSKYLEITCKKKNDQWHLTGLGSQYFRAKNK